MPKIEFYEYIPPNHMHICNSISVYFTGYLSNKDFNVVEFVFWVVGQISFVQFDNPELMREFGTGVANGSLWTISVELQFYLMVPVILFQLLVNTY